MKMRGHGHFLQTGTGRRLDATGLTRALLAHDQMHGGMAHVVERR